MPKTVKQSRQNNIFFKIMKTFDELFHEAEAISDKRKAIFNQLIERTEKEIIPAFAKVLKGYDLNKSFFTLYVRPIADMDAVHDEDGNDIWAIGIENDGRIWKCSKDPCHGRYTTYEEMRTRADESNMDLPVAEFMRSGIVDIVKKISNRIEELNKKYTLRVEEAETFLNDRI